MISDKRRLIINRIDIRAGQMSQSVAGQLWQLPDGSFGGCSSWVELLVPNSGSLRAQADSNGVSPLELLRRRMAMNPYIRIDIV